MILMAAMRKAGVDPDKLRDAIEGTKDYVGVTAEYSYAPNDHYGTKIESVVMLTVKDGKFTLAGK